LKISFKKTSKSATEPTEAGCCSYNIYSLLSYRVEPLERIGIRTGIILEFPKPREVIIGGSHKVYKHLVAEIIPREGLFLETGLFLVHKTIDCSYDGEIIIDAINMSLPDFLLYKDNENVLARSQFFGSTNSVSLGRESPIARLYISETDRIKAQ
jgi:dUTPase